MSQHQTQSHSLITVEFIAQNIIQLRDEKVILDATLAGLYGVETRVLIQAVKRNIRRFPADFMFQLTSDEFSRLRSQNVMSSSWVAGAQRRMHLLNRALPCCPAC
jgi:hypothetical protein